MPKRDDRAVVHLVCVECNSGGYATSKNRRTVTDRLELKKYCRNCRTHQVHRERR